jgi:hypothetical protein
MRVIMFIKWSQYASYLGGLHLMNMECACIYFLCLKLLMTVYNIYKE